MALGCPLVNINGDITACQWVGNDFCTRMMAKVNRDKRRLRIERARDKGTHTKEEWLLMKSFFHHRCVKCGSNKNIEKDHIQPVFIDGSDSIKNIQPLCKKCNCGKSGSVDYRISYCKSHNLELPKECR